jgi:hypothetical protein
MRRYSQCLADELANNIYQGQEISPGGRAIGPQRVNSLEGFDMENDIIFKYRLDITEDLFNSFCNVISTNNPLPNFCKIITPPSQDLLDPNCFYNYYIEVGLDDQDSLGMYFADNTDVEVFIAFRKIRCFE